MNRRDSLRVYPPFPAEVRGTDISGKRFREGIRINRVTANEVTFRLSREVQAEAQLFMIVSVSTTAQVAILGHIQNVYLLPDGNYRIHLQLTHSRLL